MLDNAVMNVCGWDRCVCLWECTFFRNVRVYFNHSTECSFVNVQEWVLFFATYFVLFILFVFRWNCHLSQYFVMLYSLILVHFILTDIFEWAKIPVSEVIHLTVFGSRSASRAITTTLWLDYLYWFFHFSSLETYSMHCSCLESMFPIEHCCYVY